MALKSTSNNGKSPNKNNDSDPNKNKGEPSQYVQETKKQSKPKKKNIKPTPTVYPVMAGNPSRRVRKTIPLMPMIRAVMPVPTMPSYYPQYPNPAINYMVPDWNAMPIQVQNPMYDYNVPFQPVPIVITPQVLSPICPYTGALLTPPMVHPPPHQPMVIEEIPAYNYENEVVFSPEQIVPAVDSHQYLEEPVNAEKSNDPEKPKKDPLDIYLELPKDMFPTARMFNIDPNPIINEFCKISNIQRHVPWILDLEFGLPRSPITRPIPIYDVKYNSVHCKNEPNAIHPGFESTSHEFKNVFIFYYDCIISTWYRGYTIFNHDTSVDGFQSWLLLPMELLGLCWP